MKQAISVECDQLLITCHVWTWNISILEIVTLDSKYISIRFKFIFTSGSYTCILKMQNWWHNFVEEGWQLLENILIFRFISNDND